MGGVPSLRLSDGGCLLWGLCCADLICGPCQTQMGLSQWPQPCRASVPAIITYDMQMGHLFPASPGHAAPPYQDSGAALVGSSEGAGPRTGPVTYEEDSSAGTCLAKGTGGCTQVSPCRDSRRRPSSCVLRQSRDSLHSLLRGVGLRDPQRMGMASKEIHQARASQVCASHSGVYPLL